jgi:hypothetical protein
MRMNVVALKNEKGNKKNEEEWNKEEEQVLCSLFFQIVPFNPSNLNM